MMRKFNLLVVFTCLILFGHTAHALQVTVVNNLPTPKACLNGNTLTLFYTDSGVAKTTTVHPGGSLSMTGTYSAMPGIGIQVNNWYWTAVLLAVEGGSATQSQNPDNSGGQFTVSATCQLAYGPAWYGKGIPTYLIASVVATKTATGCKVTISSNSYTNAVTSGCCAPPIFSSGACQQGTWGLTNTGQSWPPK